ncbi:hypothetical protein BH20ACT11_BH20ACT11_08590 [soil metagenome]|jgi:hypothetical protein
MSATIILQILSTVASVVVSGFFVYLYFIHLRLQRWTMNEMKEQRISGGRPLIIVEADYNRLPEIDLVVRNVGGGPAKNISFDFSANIKSSTGFVLTDLFYLRDGMDFLGPGGEIRCLWDDIDSLERTLHDDGLQQGIRVYSQYEGMNGDTYHSDYGINPLLYQGIRNADRADMDDLVELLDKRLPGGGDAGGESEGGSPDSAEEYEQERDEERHEDQQDGEYSGGEEAGEEKDSQRGSKVARTTPDWTSPDAASNNQTQAK